MELIELQNSIEKDQIDLGVERYRSSVEVSKSKSRESKESYGRSLLAYSVDKVSGSLKDFLQEAYSGKAGRLNASATLLSMIDADKAAYLSLKFGIDGVSTRQKMTKVAMQIGSAIEDEVKFAIFEDQAKGWFKKIQQEVCKRTADRHYRRYAIIHTMNKKAMIEYRVWSPTEQLHVGTKMLDIIVAATGLFEVQTQTVGRKQRNIYLVPTEKTLEWIEQFNARGELLSPSFMPMVVPPKPWTGITKGGYLNELARPLPLIKTHNKAYLEEMEHEEMPLVYQTQNVCQETAWGINKTVLEVMEYAAGHGYEWGDLPPLAGIPVPSCPLPSNLTKDTMDEEQKRIFTDWKRAASKVHQMNAKNVSKRVQFLRTMNMAKRFAAYDTPIHFVYQRDFRGRIYIVNPFLNFQSASFAKGLLEFANPMAIWNEEQANYMRVHGANTWGNDKVSFDERVEFIKSLDEEIKLWASDPITHRGWLDADSPWEFLSFALEYAGFLNEGFGFQSRLIVCVDGSNNGLQHLSAMLRDTIGGAATNLIPSEKPADVYKDVITLAMQMVEKDDTDLSKQWLAFGADRKCSKRPVMTRSYGSTRFSCREYVEDYIMERVAKGDEAPWGDAHFNASMHLTQFLWAAMDETIVAAKEVMDWIQSIARLYAKENLPMTWRCPNGFVVSQMYPEMTARRITTYIDNSLIKPVVNEADYSKVDSRRMANGAAPNVVHSLDAAALDMTVNNMVKALGQHVDLAFVHDSYGCHAANMPIMADALRNAFVEMYRDNNMLDYIYKEAVTLFGDKTPMPPVMGDLDIEQVRESKYFFA